MNCRFLGNNTVIYPNIIGKRYLSYKSIMPQYHSVVIMGSHMKYTGQTAKYMDGNVRYDTCILHQNNGQLVVYQNRDDEKSA